MRSIPILVLVLFSLAFMGISSTAKACPEGHVPILIQNDPCVVPGPPDSKDGQGTIVEFQMACMEATNFGGHAMPVIGKAECKAPEQLWECCEKIPPGK